MQFSLSLHPVPSYSHRVMLQQGRQQRLKSFLYLLLPIKCSTIGKLGIHNKYTHLLDEE